MTRILLWAALAIAVVIPGSGQAAIQAMLVEDGDDVVLSYDGTLDLGGATFLGSGDLSPVIALPTGGLGAAQATFGQYTGALVDFYDVTSWSVFGPGDTVETAQVEGDTFVIGAGVLVLDAGYSSGDEISGRMTFSDTTLLALGAQSGQYTWSLASDSVSLNVGSAASVPLPAGILLLLGGLGGMTIFLRKG